MEELRFEYLPIDNIKPYEKNARKHGNVDIGAIKASIEEFGFNDPIGIWHDTIVEGHGRLQAAKELGIEMVPIIRLDHLTDEQRKAYALAHNKTAELSDWDFDILSAELKDLADVDMGAFGFNLDALIEPDEVVEDDYEIELPEEPRSKRGEVWKLGVHRLMCGDATSQDDVDKLCGGGGSRPLHHGSAI